MSKRGRLNVASLFLTVGVAFAPSFAKASSIILDGDFLNPIGTGNRSYPVVRLDERRGHKTSGPGRYSWQLRKHACWFRDEASWPASLTFTVQKPLGGPWNDILTTIAVLSSPNFSKEQFTFGIPQSAGTLSELAFSNSYDAQFPHNPPGTVIDIADVSINSTVPEPSTWAMMLLGLAGFSFIGYGRRPRPMPLKHLAEEASRN